MKKVIILFVASFLLMSCIDRDSPVQTTDYKVIDTTEVCRNGFGNILGYEVIIKIDSTYFSASLNDHKKLIIINRKLTNL